MTERSPYFNWGPKTLQDCEFWIHPLFAFPDLLYSLLTYSPYTTSNLQNANHVIFFGPFAAKNLYEYQSTIAQSSGRVIRFGQKKEVHIWNLVTLNTLEVGILQAQDGRTLVRHTDGEFDLVLDDEIKANDVKGFEIPVFNWK